MAHRSSTSDMVADHAGATRAIDNVEGLLQFVFEHGPQIRAVASVPPAPNGQITEAGRFGQA
jgi:hypothetical protein